MYYLFLFCVSGVDYGHSNSNAYSAQDLCILPFSSGTTGLPKGVMITHSQMASNLKIMSVPIIPQDTLTRPTTADNQDAVLCVLPLFHMYGFVCLLMSKLSLGCKLITLSRFKPSSFITLITEHKVNFLPLVPPILQNLANDERCTIDNLKHVRTILCAAAPIGANTFQRFQAR